MEIRRIAILTGGGDCPGINAVIRAVTKTAIFQFNLKVFGIEDGYLGLMDNRIRELHPENVSNILTLGGTILGTNNTCDPSRVPVEENGKRTYKDMTSICLTNLKKHSIDALIVIGGDGTMTVTSAFVHKGVICIGVPKTIDNDLSGTDVSFGFATASYVASAALDRIHTTATSHHRVMIVEVMGRNAGWIALHAGTASGADIILIPEIPFQLSIICQHIRDRLSLNKRFSIISAAEGAFELGGEKVIDVYDPNNPEPIRLGGIGRFLAREICNRTGVETRTTVLGHVQRGGTPVPQDRILATQFGSYAIDLLMKGIFNKLVVMKNGKVGHVDILSVANKQRQVPLDDPIVIAAKNVGTCFGD